jgi:hypothetical protein
MRRKPAKTSEIAIFGHLIKTDDGNLGRDLAHYILTLGFGKEDQGRTRGLRRGTCKGP